jgi:hypothetical protein
MALVTANGVALPTPTTYDVGIMDISKAERNAAGTMIIERIATKRQINLSWNFLSASDLSAILNAVAPVFYNVTYLDPQTGTYRTGSFYCGDRNAGMVDYRNGVPRYKDVKFTLIER